MQRLCDLYIKYAMYRSDGSVVERAPREWEVVCSIPDRVIPKMV